MNDKRFGNRFKECRMRLGITQQELSDRTGLPTNYISQVERGERYPRYEKLVLLLNCLKVSADTVFQDVVEESMELRISDLSEKLDGLPIQEKQNILELVDVMIMQSQKRMKQTEAE